ncbi:hypothetical protein AAC387_Pa10g0956 [Persea americana]
MHAAVMWTINDFPAYVQYRWMYPIERLLGTLKGFVTNRAYLEGSTSEAYIVKECLTFCSMYLSGMETAFNRPERNADGGVCGTRLAVFTQNVRPFGLITRASNVTQEEIDKAHWFVLNNNFELEQYLEEHKRLLANESACDIPKRQEEKFPKSFKEHMNQRRDEGSQEATDDLWSTANETQNRQLSSSFPKEDEDEDEDELLGEPSDNELASESDSDIDPDIEP